MSRQYRKRVAARLDQVGDEFVLLRDDTPGAFALSDSAAVLWDALDHFHREEDLVLLLAEARPDLRPAEAQAEVRRFLDALVASGLVEGEGARRVRKRGDVVTELVGDELIVLSRSSRKVHLLNETGAVLWEALDQFHDPAALRALLAEAWPQKPEGELAAIVTGFLAQLTDLGLIEEA